MAAFKPAPNSAASDNTALETVQGTIERITFHNSDNGYTIAKLLPDRARSVVTILGNFSNPVVGESLICRGAWSTHAQWGRQMQVSQYEVVRPATALAIEKYLGSGMIKGIGPVMAKRIVQAFGDKALDVVDEDPKALRRVEGIGAKRADMIMQAWEEHRDVRNIMLFLQGHGVSPAYAVKIYKRYGGQAIEVFERNPYQLAADVWGIGFKVADKMAQGMGVTVDDPRRIEAGVAYVLREAVTKGGNVYLTISELNQDACAILGVGSASVDAAIENLCSTNVLVREEAVVMGATEVAIYTPQLYDAERGLAEHVLGLVDGAQHPEQTGDPQFRLPPQQSSPGRRRDAEVVHALDFHEPAPAVELSPEQDAAVRVALASRFSVLTGGPGTGKTTTTRAIVSAFERQGRTVLLASPTGRAAKRLSEVVGREAKTIHRLLEFSPEINGFKRSEEYPLECEALIVDEVSMLDTPLAHALLRAVPADTQVLFVGDVDQLPSVGPGNVLRDLIESEVVPVTRLTQVFRQAAQSLIITNAHRVNRGEMPTLPKASDGFDCVYVRADEPEEVVNKIVAVVSRSLTARGFKLEDIQVLVPMQRGTAGAVVLNQRLQHALNPPRPGVAEVERSGRLLRVGDRVMQMINDYDKGVYNGDIGRVIGVSAEESEICVDFAGSKVYYPFTDIDELTLSYACSIHKSQGSEYPAVVLAIHTQHYMLLQRNLIYTALTRAKKMAVLVGSTNAIGMAVRKLSDVKRHTRLQMRLRGMI